MKNTILLVDDEPSVLEAYSIILEDDYDLIPVRSGYEALEELRRRDVDLVLLDIMMPGMDGIETLKRIKEIDSDLNVIMVTVRRELETAVECMKLGAFDYITKPYEVDELLLVVEKALENLRMRRENLFLREEVRLREESERLIFGSEVMKDIMSMVEKVAPQDSTVLITGETGTGKELLAKEIHRRSRRKNAPFAVVNCAAIPKDLVESELFGHEKGSFTSAYRTRKGKFEIANGGTIFLDEVGTLPLESQSKLLRVLQDRTVQRVGSDRIIPVDIRVISATNLDLEEACRKGNFRSDLYYRLNVIPIHIPPLRERREDIPPLMMYFLDKFNRETKRNIEGIDQEVVDLFVNYPWPGNVRELQNVIERMVVTASGRRITLKDIPSDILKAEHIQLPRFNGLKDLKSAIEEFEKFYIGKVLKETRGNRSKAAEILGVHRSTLSYKIRQFSLGDGGEE